MVAENTAPTLVRLGLLKLAGRHDVDELVQVLSRYGLHDGVDEPPMIDADSAWWRVSVDTPDTEWVRGGARSVLNALTSSYDDGETHVVLMSPDMDQVLGMYAALTQGLNAGLVDWRESVQGLTERLLRRQVEFEQRLTSHPPRLFAKAVEIQIGLHGLVVEPNGPFDDLQSFAVSTAEIAPSSGEGDAVSFHCVLGEGGDNFYDASLFSNGTGAVFAPNRAVASRLGLALSFLFDFQYVR